MATNEQLASIAAILCTLAEVAPTGEVVAASSVYLAVGMNMMEYTCIVNALTNGGLIRATPSTIRITLKGKELADRINAKLADKGCNPEKLVK